MNDQDERLDELTELKDDVQSHRSVYLLLFDVQRDCIDEQYEDTLFDALRLNQQLMLGREIVQRCKEHTPHLRGDRNIQSTPPKKRQLKALAPLAPPPPEIINIDFD